MSGDRRKRILLVAYACRPGESSEREVGWRWANLIQTRHDITVLTRETHKPYILDWIARQPDSTDFPEFIFYDLPTWIRRFKKRERGLYLYYALWSFRASLKARKLNRHRPFDIVHFLTFGTLIWPQFTFLVGSKYVLGPVGGGERIPLSLRRAFNASGQIKIVTRRLVQLSLLANPIFWANLIHADRILVRTRETLEMIPAIFRSKTELLLETAKPEALGNWEKPASQEKELTIVSVGRLIASKFNPLFLEALREFKDIWGMPFRVIVIGDGPERTHLERRRKALGLDEVIFAGAKDREEVFAVLRESDIYFSTTMKEGGSWAFFEAIEYRLPVVCLKVNGPDMIVGDGCGIKVPPDRYDQTRAALAQGLLVLASDPVLRRHYADEALAYLESAYTWNRVLDRIDAVYLELTKDKCSDGEQP